MKTVLPPLHMSLLGVILALGPMAAVQAKTPADQLIVGMSMVNLFSIDPANAPGLDASGVNANLYDTLVKRDQGNPEKHLPQLAERWAISEDGKQITFHLRTDVTFHSGNALTAEDVAWSLYRVMKLNYGLATTWKAYGYTVDNIQALIRASDAHTLVIDLPQPTDPLLLIDSLATSPSAVIVDRLQALKHEKNGDLGAAWLVTNEAGSGPFTLAKWSANDALVMNRFDGYWAGPAKMKRVLVRHMTESQSLRLMLERGDLDLAYGMAAPDIKAVERTGTLQVQPLQRGTMYYVAMSMKQPEFANPKVREAVRYLIDYKGIDEQVMPHYGLLNQQPMQLGLDARLPDPGYRLDVAKAKALLSEAGYPQGFSTTLRTLSEPPFIDIGRGRHQGQHRHRYRQPGVRRHARTQLRDDRRPRCRALPAPLLQPAHLRLQPRQQRRGWPAQLPGLACIVLRPTAQCTDRPGRGRARPWQTPEPVPPGAEALRRTGRPDHDDFADDRHRSQRGGHQGLHRR